ncbi:MULTISPECIES: alpha/beta hydrolase [Actinosynnema]|uniref:alpha/beta hydrolase n=1 Tax=Actinosynnema TaxID=40566 RepID=UPI0020A3EE8D|nr:hypothetical protein [Actinosynnema pretiosum]MCP2096585.1 Lysophospholipase, alpha-beta hydrolase superfamily [Actinosynnema pretiosum]
MTAQIDAAQVEHLLQHVADSFGRPMRSPLTHFPHEAGLAHQDVTFPSRDGVPLEGWFIPADNPVEDRVVICNHPFWFSRAGLPAHLEPWRSTWSLTGNDFDVDFVPDYKLLHDAGYHVLAYDLRNSGLSGAANGGVFTGGVLESRDVLGSLDHVRSRTDLRDPKIALFSRCAGANATFRAMSTHPEDFAGVRCLVAPQPMSARVTLERTLRGAGLPQERVAELEHRIRMRTSLTLDGMSPIPWAGATTVPTLLYQVRDDVLTDPADVQAVHDAIPVEKDLFWIEGTTRRFDGYTHFQRDPARVLAWLDAHLS